MHGWEPSMSCDWQQPLQQGLLLPPLLAAATATRIIIATTVEIHRLIIDVCVSK